MMTTELEGIEKIEELEPKNAPDGGETVLPLSFATTIKG